LSALADQLVNWANSAQDLAWSRFKVVTKHAAKFNLTAADVDRWTNPGEPAFVAHLVSDEANLFLRQAVAGHTVAPWQPESVAVSSVFIHQKPKVEFGKGQIEIGDLLLVRQHFVKGNPLPQGSAFLLQAKTSSSPKTGRLKGNEALQFELYRDWPTFTFPSYPAWLPTGASSWDFSGSSLTDRTGLYGIVYPKELRHMTSSRRKLRFADDCAWGVGTRQDFGASAGFGTVNASKHSLGAFMEGFISGSLGRPWAFHQGDHWSQFVMQVMARAANERWMYPIQRVGIRSRPRLQPGMPLRSSLTLAFQGADLLRRRTGDGMPTVLAIRDWLQGTDHAIGGDGYGAEFPPDDLWATGPSGRGRLSLVYVGTFGDRPLDDLPLDDAPRR
jgi:hypothetical protein